MARNIKAFETFARQNNLKINRDRVEDVILGLKEKHRVFGVAYCPCVPQYLHKIPDTVCPCTTLKEERICHCGLFVEDIDS